jgi:integrase/recombinase XerC
LLKSIEASANVGLRDRALIGLMVHAFARVGAALGMKVEDACVELRRLWVRLHEKGGEQHALPCHHNLEAWLRIPTMSAGHSELKSATCSDPSRPAVPIDVGRGGGSPAVRW